MLDLKWFRIVYEKVRFMAEKKLVKREKRLGFNWFFWISFLAIVIPVAYFGRLLYLASQDSNVPINGTRIQDTVIYEINSTQVTELNEIIKTIEGVEGCNSNLAVQTLRITINANDSLDTDAIKALAEKVYNAIDEKLPIETYFTRVDNIKEYDLEITIYDNLSNESPVIVLLTKNAASEEEKLIQVLSSPVNQKVTDNVLATAEELEKEQQQSQQENADTQSDGPTYQQQGEGTGEVIGDGSNENND